MHWLLVLINISKNYPISQRTIVAIAGRRKSICVSNCLCKIGRQNVSLLPNWTKSDSSSSFLRCFSLHMQPSKCHLAFRARHDRDQSGTDGFKWKHGPYRRRPLDTQKKGLNPTICHSTAILLFLILHSVAHWKVNVSLWRGHRGKHRDCQGEIFCFAIIKANDRTQKWFFCPTDHWEKWPSECTFVVVLIALVFV